MGKILLFIIVTPIIDLYILIKASQNMGFWTTIGLIIATGIAGYYLAKSEGKIVLSNINNQLSQGRVPGEELLTGLSILIGGIFLVVPGIVTDIMGITMILPGTREIYKNIIRRYFTNRIKRGNTRIFLRW
ncbi:FxsA family protein [Anaerosalibacter massiliensis]|uniref:FxsA family protein n=1 Tax=Anaerosalibacter massiliensis TaxID=1347392 RepID=A0A9X2S4Y8_9FIRM|nr:FxsA family protein [Anaerosalibacter massiliensis]MCR2043978.1 FxsA family protein [Anaerosalibacter massiliensis]